MVEYSITAGQEMGMTMAARSPDGNLGYRLPSGKNV
jgi:hypothetical protein